MSRKVQISRPFYCALLFGCSLSLFFVVTIARSVLAKESGEDDYKFLKTFTDVISLVQKNYVEVVDMKTLVEGALKGMLQTLDPHSGYLNEDTYNELRTETKGEFGGLGIEITVKDNLLTVVAPIEDSPAFRVGVKAGDQIIKIDDQFAKDMSMVDAVKKMRGPQGSAVTISVHRKDRKDLIPFTITREVIKVKSVRARTLEDRFAYVRVAQFQEDTTTELQKALADMQTKMKDKKVHGLVLDLRNNPGGLLNQATRVSDYFLKDGVIVYTDGRLESQKQKYYAHDDGNEPEYPMIVLVNGGSASAAEIVAGAMQDSGRSVVLGQQSFGKGSVQTILPMDNGGALRLTTALYFTRNGRSIQAQGITPDIVVEDKRPGETEEEPEGEELGPIKEKDLPGAFKNPLTKDKDKPGEKKPDGATEVKKKPVVKKDDDDSPLGTAALMSVPLEKLLKNDPQLEEALKLLKTWHVFQGKPTVEANVPAAVKSVQAAHPAS